MRAAQVVSLTGPADIEVRQVPEPVPGPHDVLVEVHSTGVSFPDLLLSRGEYQFRPEPPFTIITPAVSSKAQAACVTVRR